MRSRRERRKMEQLSIFNCYGTPYKAFKIKKPIRLIELFAGVGAQAMALRNIGADFEHYRVVEFDKFAIASYNAIHGTNFQTSDIKEVKGVDLGIVEKSRFTYLLTYLLIPLHRFERCGKDERHGERKRNKLCFIVGSSKTPRRVRGITTSFSNGERATSSFSGEYATISKMD